MVTVEEGTHSVGDISLFTKTWKPEGPPKAKLIFVHGFNDHIDRYYELFPTLASRGIEVHGFDQRGWGRSVKTPKDRGHAGTTTQVISDLASFVKAQLPSSVPVFVMGHSMGGGEVLTLASDPKYADLANSIRGWLTESPLIRLPAGQEPPWLKVIVGRLAGRLLPKFQLLAGLPPKNLTRDPEVIKSIEQDKLLHGYGTLEQLAHMLDRTALLGDGKTKLNPGVQSVWISHGTVDMGTSCEASRKWFAEQTTLKDKELKIYEGWYHQLHAHLPETRSIFAKDVGDWILARCDQAEPRAATESKL